MSAGPGTGLGVGLGFKPQHFDEAMENARPGVWFEVHPENYQVCGGPRWQMLHALRERHALSLHSVSLSLASPEAVDEGRLALLCDMHRRLQPALVSEHLAWSWWRGVYAPDLLPVRRSHALMAHLVRQIDRVQSALGSAIAIENPSHYVGLMHDVGEVDFLNELCRRSGCMLLVDVNNVAVSAHNLGLDAQAWLEDIDADQVAEVHLAGHEPDEQWGEALWIDSHSQAVADEVWLLYAQLIARLGPKPTLIERDSNIPAYEVLQAEADRARGILAARMACRPQSMATALLE